MSIDERVAELPEALRQGVEDLVGGIVEVFEKHADDPDRGDLGWRKQTIEQQLEHAQEHCENAWVATVGNAISISAGDFWEDDGLSHWKHAGARLVLACSLIRLKNLSSMK